MSMEPYVQAHSGVNFYFLEPKADQILIEDIAHALSMQCRFAGHIRKFYSVAEHSINVARLVPNEMKLQALLHDASEAYLTDIPSPIKVLLPDYMKIEDVVQRAICEKYNVGYPFEPEVKEADKACLIAEARNMLPITEYHWTKNPDYYSIYELADKYVVGYTPDIVAKVFMMRFNEYARIYKRAA